MHLFVRPMQAATLFVRTANKVFPTNLFQSMTLFFALFRNARGTTSLMSHRDRVCRCVTREDPKRARRLARPWTSMVTWSLVNFYGKNLTSCPEPMHEIHRMSFPFFSIWARDLCVPSHPDDQDCLSMRT